MALKLLPERLNGQSQRQVLCRRLTVEYCLISLEDAAFALVGVWL